MPKPDIYRLLPRDSLLLGNGTRFRSEPLPMPTVHLANFDGVSDHEARHALVARKRGVGVVYASRIPQGSAHGVTQLTSYDGPSFAAGGGPGGAYDRSVIEYMGGNVSSDTSTANLILANNKLAHAAVASIIFSRGTVTGHEIDSAIVDAEKVIEAQRRGPRAILYAQVSGSKEHVLGEAPVVNGEVTLEPGKWFYVGNRSSSLETA